MWECRCSWADVSAVTCTGEGNNLRSSVSLGFSCSPWLPVGWVMLDMKEALRAAGNLSCRARCLLLTETTLQSEALGTFFHVPLQNKLLEKQEASSPQSPAAAGWFVYWEAGDGSHSLTGETEVSFPYWKTASSTLSPAYRLTLDLKGCFLLWILSSVNFDDLLEGAMLSFFPLRSAYRGYGIIIFLVVFKFLF